ncbi:hypothetical protein hrd7_28250 [Leptolinea sp. HRD-7]|nr:hypothetical protein hrd7_28250 [Leptolinea sp. HRD-7]
MITIKKIAGDEEMIKKAPPFFHYFLGIMLAGTTLLILKYYVHNAILRFFGMGILCTILGIWGNKVKLVFFRIPWGDRSYKIINYFTILVGIFFLIYSVYLYTFPSP